MPEPSDATGCQSVPSPRVGMEARWIDRRPKPRHSYLEILSALDAVPLVHRLRAEAPVHYVPSLGFWFATRHDDVKRLFRDPENVTPDRRAWERFEPRPEGSMLRWVDDAGPLALAPEAHARMRRLVASAFTPRAVRRM